MLVYYRSIVFSYAVLKSQLALNVSSKDHTHRGCGLELTLTWTPTFRFEVSGRENTTTPCDLHNVTFDSTYSITSLSSKLCWLSGSDENVSSIDLCSSLDSAKLIKDGNYTLSYPGPHLAVSADSPSLLVWLKLEGELVNGSLLCVSSDKVLVDSVMTQCGTNNVVTSKSGCHKCLWPLYLLM